VQDLRPEGGNDNLGAADRNFGYHGNMAILLVSRKPAIHFHWRHFR
jgi:hypothetical protein